MCTTEGAPIELAGQALHVALRHRLSLQLTAVCHRLERILKQCGVTAACYYLKRRIDRAYPPSDVRPNASQRDQSYVPSEPRSCTSGYWGANG